jgi:hypothetical protein
MPAEFKAEPIVVEKKTFNPKDHMTEEQIKKMEEGGDDNQPALTLDGKIQEEDKSQNV